MTGSRPSLGLSFLDPAFWLREDRAEVFARARRDLPLTWHEEPSSQWFPDGGRGFWSLVRHEDVTAVSKDQETFTSAEGTEIIDMPPAVRHLYGGMLNMSGEQHHRYRSIVNRVLTPRTVEAMTEDIDAQAVRAIQRVVHRGSADFVQDIVGDYPAQIIGDLLSVPVEDRARLVELTVIGLSEAGTARSLNAYQEIVDYALELLDRVRGSGVRDNFLGRLLAAQEAGRGLDDQEVAIFFALLLTAGIETTATTLAGGFLALSQFPEQRRLLQSDFEARAPHAVEELIRWVTPIRHFRRTATRDVEMHGQTIRRGEKVVLWYESANRDESVFEKPFELDLSRDPNPHVGFGGGGPHFCLGAVLARKEAVVFLRRLFQMLPDIEVSGPAVPLHSAFVNGLESLPVTFTPVEAP